jgi:hypothetical protein
MKKSLLTALMALSVLTGTGRTTKGKEFWIGFMENISLSFNGPPAFKLHINCDITTTCTMSVPFTGFTTTFVVNGNQTYILDLPAGNFNPLGDEATANNGIMVSANDSVEVKAFHHRMFFTESTLVLPLQEIGSDYILTAQQDGMNNSPSEFVVLATQNNTTVQITPAAVTLGTRPAGVAFTVTIQKGQMYQLQSMTDLSGTLVKSMNALQKIAVFSGARQAQFGCNMGADDHIYDQAYPVSSFGKQYNVVPFSGHIIDQLKIVGSQNSTTVTASGIGTFTLNKGSVVTFPITAATEISSNFPVSVAQFATSQGCNGSTSNDGGDPGMINLVPADLYTKKAVFYTLPSLKLGGVTDRFTLHRLNVVIKTSAIGNLKLDNVAIPSTSFTPVNSTSPYSYARLILDTLGLLNHVLTCDSGFNATIYSFMYYNFYGHHLGYNTKEPANTTGLKKNISSSMLRINPKTARETITISAPENFRSIVITDVCGKTVLKQDLQAINTLDLDIADLANGFYYCTLHFSGDTAAPETIKFLKSCKE